MPCESRARIAFTLIELLVVVAIIAMLTSILLPTLGHARQHARSVKCLGQCRELAHGMTFYHVENGNYPVHQWRLATGDRLRWFNVMAMYVGGAPNVNSEGDGGFKRATVQRCPSTPEWNVSRNNSYGYNYKYLGSARENLSAENPRRPFERFPVTELRNPGMTIAFADCDGTGWTLPWGPERGPDYPDADQNPDRIGNHGYTLDPTYIPIWSEETTSGGASEPYAWHDYRSYMSDRHMGKAATIFADGHGDMVDPHVAYRDNALWNGIGFDPGSDPSEPNYDLDPHVDYKYASGSGQGWRYPTADDE
jgi:prepilin-type N-terminal cleavage/methylation domain-containing protein